jgi:hypothetical protein
MRRGRLLPSLPQGGGNRPQGDTELEDGRRCRRLIDIFRHGTKDVVFKISVRDALRDRGAEAIDVIQSELQERTTKRV